MFLTRSKIRLLFISSGLLLLYLLRLQSALNQSLVIPDDTSVKYTGKVAKQPYLKDSYQVIPMQDLTVKTDRFPAYSYGDRLEVIGKTKREVTNPFKSEIVLYWPHIKQISGRSDSINQTGVVLFLYRLRSSLEASIYRCLPEPESSLLVGILLGIGNQLPQNLTQNLRNTGTIHVVVASGFNVALIAGGLVAVLVIFFKRRPAVLLSVIGILAYAIMAGGEPPVTRAAVMGIILCLAQVFGREYQALRALVLTGILMILISPLMLFDIGFQLSYLATIGLLVISPRLKGKIFKIPVFGEGLGTTLAAQSTTLPILLLNFGQTNVLSPLVNALVLPIVPITMVLGGITALLGMVSLPFSKLTGMIAYVFLHYFVIVVNFFGQFAWPVVELNFSLVLVVVYYATLLLVIGKKRLSE